MSTRTINFDVCKASADYTCACSECGKVLKRKATVEHTVNPWNKNDAGQVKTRAEVYASARVAAEKEALQLQGVPDICRDCADEGNRGLLLAMAADPARVWPAPDVYWNSPIHVLVDRKHAEQAHVKCECGSDCCSGWKRNPGYRITKKGLARALQLQPKQVAA